jgi:hypothetical protein
VHQEHYTSENKTISEYELRKASEHSHHINNQSYQSAYGNAVNQGVKTYHTP